MRTTYVILSLSILLVLGGCSSRPISKTYHHTKKAYNTTKEVYRTTKAVAEVANPLEYIYISEYGEAVTPDGQPFMTHDAMLGQAD